MCLILSEYCTYICSLPHQMLLMNFWHVWNFGQLSHRWSIVTTVDAPIPSSLFSYLKWMTPLYCNAKKQNKIQCIAAFFLCVNQLNAFPKMPVNWSFTVFLIAILCSLSSFAVSFPHLHILTVPSCLRCEMMTKFLQVDRTRNELKMFHLGEIHRTTRVGFKTSGLDFAEQIARLRC